ncbi:NirD/YgiW/YdeI family stress tolerance protein [Muribacter muris]|uniref:NirD/YgiW/YdeI family stress tolerance protein n=1 Tax=Muribacter muris TaxID=67855 RepID=A0A4Y9JTW5_9PAST|nr:NirD/YgiW/YdeI family stress tolerance protein [Muribacter muris]MBF0785878.1 YgiW/YdeI family stress tolerance OB fold protein [Muribacter muris]MBF0827208.1 YgiW/YdeI family stress tolerance OB fold protein [Muribacter muris]TFV08319.1 NirD/YgiW/YdeI family stress tolerance protein [Muribacter muris]
MKKVFTLVSLFALSSFANAGFNGNQSAGGGFSQDGKTLPSAITTVAQALKAQDDAPVQLTGYITRQIDNDEFMFKDNSGEIKIDVEDEAWQGQNITPKNKITIYGKVDKDWHNSVDVYRIQKH